MIIWGNFDNDGLDDIDRLEPVATFSLIEGAPPKSSVGGLPWLIGDDPLFLDDDAFVLEDRDYSISGTSPARNAGRFTTPRIDHDIRQEKRRAVPDAGAYEQDSSSTAVFIWGPALVLEGQTLNLRTELNSSLGALDVLGQLDFAWYKDETLLEQTTRELQVTDIAESDEGVYRLEVTDNLSNVYLSQEHLVDVVVVDPDDEDEEGGVAAFPDSLFFGYVELGSRGEKELVLTNSGDTAATMNISTSSPFSLFFGTSGTVTLEPGDIRFIPVYFLPPSEGAYNAAITISGDYSETIPVYGHNHNDPTSLPGVIRINEVVSSNTAGPKDEDGNYQGWVEIYNGENAAVDLSGWTLSDGIGTPWAFPNIVLNSGELMVVFCSGPGNGRPPLLGKYLHTDFYLNTEGGTVELKTDLSVTQSTVTYPALPGNSSLTYSDALEQFIHVLAPTPCEK
jgi:hypothetical protein